MKHPRRWPLAAVISAALFLSGAVAVVLAHPVSPGASGDALRDVASTTRAQNTGARHHAHAARNLTLCSTILREHDESRVAQPIEEHCRRFLTPNTHGVVAKRARHTAKRHAHATHARGTHTHARTTTVSPPAFSPTTSAARVAAQLSRASSPQGAAAVAGTSAAPASASKTSTPGAAAKQHCASTARTTGCVSRAVAELVPEFTPDGTAQIKGEVTNAAATKTIEGIEVCASGEETFECVTSGANGEYDIPGLAAGEYRVSFAVPYESELNYLLQYYDGKATYEEATPVVLASGATATGVNAAMQEGGQITGKVTDAKTKAGIEGIEACAYSTADEYYVERCAKTKAGGAYDIVALSTAGYKVEFYRPYTSSLNYLPQYYNGKSTYEEAAVVPVTAPATTKEINAALSEGAQIKGKVTNASTKAAIAKILVCAQSDEDSEGCAETNASGEYAIGGLLGGEYRVEFQPGYESDLNYLHQYYDDTTNYDEATLVPTAIGTPATGINAALQPGGELSGTVKSAASKEGVEDVEVCASEDSGEYVDRCAETNTKGEYTVVAIPTGNYIVEFYPSGPYAPQYYNEKVSFEEATTLSITAGTLTPNINASLQPGGELTGKVTNEKTKAAVADVEVCPELVNAESSVSCTDTDEDGEYALTKLPAAEYRVEFSPAYEANYLLQYYDGKSTAEEATIVTLAAGAKKPGINAALHEGGTISGVVTNAVTKADVEDIEVCAESTTGDEFFERCAYSDEAGKYSIVGLPTGSYRVWFSSYDDAYAEQYYNDKTFSGEAELVPVTAGTPTNGINAAMQPVASIRGIVTSKATKAPAVDVEVCVLEASNGEYVQCVDSGDDGEYAFTTLGAGEYKIEFGVNGDANYTPQYYNDKATLAEANVVTLATGEDKTEINAALQEGGEISGTVVDATTTKPVEGIEVCGYKDTGEYVYHCSDTNTKGEYTVVGLPSGDYVVEFYPDGHNYLTQYYNGKANYDEATAVPVSLGETTPEINASLKPGAEITGIVKTAGTGGAAIADADICADPRVSGFGGCAFTNASGEYAIVGLTTGEYTVEFTGGGQNYVAQYYNDKAKSSEATAVSATQGSTTPNINASLEVGGEITGVVEATKTKEPIEDVSVDAYETNGTYVASGYTNTKGEYTVEGLATGEYKLEFYSNTEEYKTQYYKAKESLSEATAVPVTSDGHITPGINAALVLAPPFLVSSPTITGKDQEGHTLTEGHGTWKNSPTEYTYQWVLCNEYGYDCTAIEHATKQTYELVFEDVGHTLRVEETAHNETGPSSPASSAQTEVIAIAPPENTKLPKMTGTAQQGKELKEVAGTWTNEPTKAKLQWLRCNASGGECAEIPGATSSTYTPVAEDVGHTLRVRETAENGAGPGTPASSEPTAEVVPPIPVNTALPKITGTAQQGKELKEQQGTWEYSPTERKYQWLQCNTLGEGCLPINGATEQKYIARPEDVGHTLRVEEYAKNTGGTGGPAVSAQTAEVLPAPPVDVTPPTIEGTAQQGKTLTEHHGTWENNPTTYKYEWLLCNASGGECAAIKGAKEEPYAVVEADVGHTIRVAETAENRGGKSAAAADSEPTAVVVPPAPVLKSAPTITGTAKQGKELTLHHGAWEYSPTSYEDKWLRCDAKGESCENTGETGETYKLAAADVGHELRVEEVAINEGGHSTPATSAPTGVVANAAPEDQTPPTIEGTAQQGKELTLQHGKWTNEPIDYEDQWLRCNEHGEECKAITGADETKYKPGKEDVGHELRVEEKAHNEGGTSSPTDSAPTVVVLPEAPVDVKPPTITGEAIQGKTLTEHHGTWENSPTGYTLHWLECNAAGEGCLPISGAEGETYKPTSLDVGHTIRVEEVAYNTGGNGEPATSAATAVVKAAGPVDVSPPTIAGTPENGQTLVEQHGAWTNEPTSYKYQWLHCSKTGTECKAIVGAVNPMYGLTAGDVGTTLEVQEIAINEGGESAPATSGPTGVVQPIPLHAVAGENINTTEGALVHFDGSGSTPANEIEKYKWEFGGSEGDGEGAQVTHTYATAGAYTAKLTVTRGAESESATVTVTVVAAPSHEATIEVTDASHNPLVGATVLYIGPSDQRIQGVTAANGKVELALPNGTETVYAYKSGYQPSTGPITVSSGEGEASIALSSGEVAASTLKSHEMTLKEIEAAGINPSEPGNENVYEFEVRLNFEREVTLHCYVNSHGEFVGGCTGGGGGGGGGGGWGGGWGGGGPSCSPNACVGGGVVATPAIVEGKPLIQWLILRGKVTVLKQFFEVTQVIQDLSPEPFKLAAGSATLNVPPGMSLAPTATPQSATQAVAEIAGNSSAETNWIVRGDEPGEYFLSANYHSKLEPFEAAVELESRLASPLKVWGVEALSLKVEADEGFLAEGQPYNVHIGVTDKAPIPLYNVDIEIDLGVHERFIFQPNQEASHEVSELKPGETVFAPEDILVPDAASESSFKPEKSSAHFVGEEIHPGVGIEAIKPPPLYSISAPTDTPHFIHLHWQPTPGAEGYEVFSTPNLDTAFGEEPEEVFTSPGAKSGVHKLPASATDAYVPYSGTEVFWAVTSIVGGRPTLDHDVIKAAQGTTGSNGEPIGGPLTPGELGPSGENPSESCLCDIAKFLSFVLPVDAPNGAFWHSFTDFSIPGRGIPLELTRTYNSTFASDNGPFGYGWSSPYSMNLTFPDAQHVVVNQENGSQITFEESGGSYVAPPRVQATLTRSEGGWVLTRRHREFFVFNSAGRLTQERELNGYKTTLAYNGKGEVTRVTDPAGRKITFTYSGNHIATATDPMGHVVHYEYDAEGNLVNVIDAAGGASHFTYDSVHRMLTMRTPNQAPGVPGSTEAVVRNTYNAAGQVTEQTDQLGHTTKFEYTGEPFGEAGGTTTVTNPSGDVTVQNYKWGLLQSETQGSGTTSAATWKFEYDPATLGVTAATDPNGHTTTSTYDTEGNVLTRTDPLGHTTSFTYDALNDLLTMTDPLGVTTTFTYDAHGNKLSESTPLTGTSQEQTTKFVYGSKKYSGDVTERIDAEGHVTTYAYDKYGDRTSITNPDHDTTETTYNVDGWRTSTISPRGIAKGEPANFTTTYAYNALGELTETVEPLGRKTTQEFDHDGNVTATTDPEGKATQYVYNAADERTEIKRPDGTTLRTVFNPDGTVKEEVDAAGHATKYEYDALGRRIAVTGPLGRTTHYTYDPAGNTTTVTDAEGNVTTTTYDADNEVTSVTYSDGKTPNVSGITYDADGQRIAETNGSESWSWSWDSLHRLTQVVEGGNGTVSYGYDLRNLLTTIKYPHGTMVTRGYDAAGRWTSVQDSHGNTTSFTYDEDGNLVKEQLPSATATTDTSVYNDADEVTEINDVAHGAALFKAQYGRSPTGLVSSDTSAPASTGSYRYDALDQVCYAGSSATEECAAAPSGSTSYAYDAAGNITRDGNATQTYDEGDQLCWSTATPTTGTCASAPAGATKYSFNALGERVASTPASGPASTYEYDQAGRLDHFAQGKVTASYTYSGDGLRMSKTVKKATTNFVWDVSTGIPALLEENKIAYVYGPEGRPLEQINGKKVLWLHHDQLGSTRVITNATGEQVGSYTYSPYGTLLTSTGTAKVPLRFAGQYEDSETGLYYMLARYYDPKTAQFMTPDPLGASSGSPYGYVNGDPLNFTDPLGLFGLPDLNPIDWGKAAVHATVGAAVTTFHAVKQVAVWAAPVAKVVQQVSSDVSTVAGDVAAVCAAGALVTSETIVGGIGFSACAAAAGTVATVSSGVATVADADLWLATGKPGDFFWDLLGTATWGEDKGIESLIEGERGRLIYEFGKALLGNLIGAGEGAFCPSS